MWVKCTGLLFCFAFAGPAMANSQGAVTSLANARAKVHPKAKAWVRFLATPDDHGTKSAFVSHLTIPPGGKVPEHRDATEEYIYFLAGGGTMWIDGQKFLVKKDDLVFMPAGAQVRFIARSDMTSEALQIFAPSGPEKKYDTWVAPETVSP